MIPSLPSLPILEVLPQLKKELSRTPAAVLAAEPGSGKTTIVPLALLDEPWLNGKKIIMLEPRRLAARMAAKRMSDLAGDRVGGLVGYRIRFDTKVGTKTRIEVVTEGILTRMLQSDPELTGIGLIIFDEFHLRSIHADLAMALCLEVMQLHDDLKMLVMSATMDTNRMAKLLGGAPVVTGCGRCYPVTVNYLPRHVSLPLIPKILSAINTALANTEGDILVFLPGAGEIRAIQQQLDTDACCLPLYGNLSQQEQDSIFLPAPKRKIILATPIAETSLTIDGISVVIDSGLVKIPKFSPATGLSRLETVAISKASAEQRAGRAGRLGPGICYRLWTEGEHHSRPAFLPPEIIDADLAPLLMECLQWGVSDPGKLSWLDPPRRGQINQARELLEQLGIIDPKGNLTNVGQQCARLPLHPRLGILLQEGKRRGHGPLACRLAALLENRDILAHNQQRNDVDIQQRLELVDLFVKNSSLASAKGAVPERCRRILVEEKQYSRLLNIKGNVTVISETGNLLAAAYPDRIAKRQQTAHHFQLATGRRALLPEHDLLGQEEYLVIPNLDSGKREGKIFLAAALDRDVILRHHYHLLVRQQKIHWNGQRIEATSLVRLGILTIAAEPLEHSDPDNIRACLLDAIRQSDMELLDWTPKAREMQARLQSLHDWQDEWPDVSDQTLLDDLTWLKPYLIEISTAKQLQQLDLYSILLSRLDWNMQRELDRLAPTHYTVPSGSRKKLQYTPGEPPILAVRLQEMFGATTTPTVYDGKIPVVVHLLSPANRPIQVTQDLAGFWKRTYNEVKKELKGRYPKHYWPDDPMTAVATSRVRPK